MRLYDENMHQKKKGLWECQGIGPEFKPHSKQNCATGKKMLARLQLKRESPQRTPKKKYLIASNLHLTKNHMKEASSGYVNIPYSGRVISSSKQWNIVLTSSIQYPISPANKTLLRASFSN
jgi:hypothetical protein